MGVPSQTIIVIPAIETVQSTTRRCRDQAFRIAVNMGSRGLGPERLGFRVQGLGSDSGFGIRNLRFGSG